MQFQSTYIFQQLTLKQKISIVVSIIIALILLFFFAVTFFFIFLGVAVVALISRLLFGRGNGQQTYTTRSQNTRIYRHDPRKDDDVIDV